MAVRWEPEMLGGWQVPDLGYRKTGCLETAGRSTASQCQMHLRGELKGLKRRVEKMEAKLVWARACTHIC